MFARKLVRINKQIIKEVEAEAVRMVELSRCDDSVHQNIVAVFRHGRLKPTNLYYYIDMELGDFTLENYLSSFFSIRDTKIDLASMSNCNGVVVQRDCSPAEKMQNLWTIGVHIASGLEFVHSRKYVHRDLKPANGHYAAYQF